MEILRKIGVLFICVGLTVAIGNAQSSFFTKKYTSSLFDQGNGITQLPDSSYAVTGTSGGFDDETGQAYLMLLDSLGNYLWTKSYGESGDDVGVRVMHVPGEGFYIAGYSSSTENGDFDFVLYKTDEQGELLWTKYYGDENWQRLYDAKLLSDGGLILVGQTEGATTQAKDMFLVRTDDEGEVLWSKILETPEDDVAFSVDTLSSTLFIVAGEMGNNGESAATVICYDLDGNEQWQEFYDDLGKTKAHGVYVFIDHFYLVGAVKNVQKNQHDTWISKVKLTGEVVEEFQHSYDEGSGVITAVAIRSEPDMFVGIQTDAVDLGIYPGGYDILVNKFATGTIYYNSLSINYSGFDDDVINNMMVTNDGGIALVGTVSDDAYKHSYGTNVLVAKIGADDSYTETAEAGINFLSLNKEEQVTLLSVHPNPANNKIHLSEKVLGLEYQLQDSQGRVVKKGEVTSILEVQGLVPGVYYLTINGVDQLWTAKIIKE